MGSPASPRNVGAVQPPPRSPFTYSTYPLLHSPILILHSFVTRFLSSRYHFVCLFRGEPRVASRVTLLAYSSLTPHAYIYRSYTRPLSAYRPMHAALHFPVIHQLVPRLSLSHSFVTLATRESTGLHRVFSINRDEPHSRSNANTNVNANAHADFRAPLIAPGGGVCEFRNPRRRYIPPVCFVSLAVTQADVSFLFLLSHILRARQGTVVKGAPRKRRFQGGRRRRRRRERASARARDALARERARCNRAVTAACIQSALS